MVGKRVAVTGGVACGKTSLSRFLRALGAQVMSADDVVHFLLSHDRSVKKAVVDLLGQEVLDEEGRVSRERVGDLVFSCPKKLAELEIILHPRVAEQIEKVPRDHLFIAEVPLLFETKMEDLFDMTVVVAAPRAKQKQWFLGNHFETRLSRQLPLEEKIKRADVVLVNRGTLDDLEIQASTLFNVINLYPT